MFHCPEFLFSTVVFSMRIFIFFSNFFLVIGVALIRLKPWRDISLSFEPNGSKKAGSKIDDENKIRPSWHNLTDVITSLHVPNY